MVFRNFTRNRNEKIKVKMNKPVYLGLSIIEISKTLMYKFCYDYIKPKYQHNANYAIWIPIVDDNTWPTHSC